MSPNILVIHPFQQHSFKTAVAIKKTGRLYGYMTSVYDKKGSITSFVKRFLRGDVERRANGRKSLLLNDSEIILNNELLGLVLLLFQRINNNLLFGWVYKKLLNEFNKKAFRYISRHPEITTIVVYDILAAKLIELLKSNKTRVSIVLDMSAPYYNYMESIFRNDMEKYPEGAFKTLSILNDNTHAYRRIDAKFEIEHADFFLVASEFSKKSLVANGIDETKIFKCIYGIDDFVNMSGTINKEKSKPKGPLKVIFVGRVCREKGAYQIIRVCSKFPKEKLEVSFYGSYDVNDPMYVAHKDRFSFMGHIPRSKMSEAYKSNDILICSSLADGFGFVIPEALSNGLPVISSMNAGASELIKDGQNGYKYDSLNDSNLFNILNDIIYQSREIPSNVMCKESVRHLLWEEYDRQISEVFTQIYR